MIEVLRTKPQTPTIVYVTKDEEIAIQYLKQIKPADATYFQNQGRKIGYHWILDDKEVGNFLTILPK